MKKLFTNDKFFLAMVISAIIGELGGVFYAVLVWKDNLLDRLPSVFCLACIALMYIAYRKHSKNVMKGMIGAWLMGFLLTTVMTFNTLYEPIETVLCWIYFVLALFLFINHFIINADRKSSPLMITANQIIVCLIAVLVAIWNIWAAIFYAYLWDTVFDILGIIGTAASVASIVCVESRLDAYRLDREEAGWTEEKGYPEGYVHEYQKKKGEY